MEHNKRYENEETSNLQYRCILSDWTNMHQGSWVVELSCTIQGNLDIWRGAICPSPLKIKYQSKERFLARPILISVIYFSREPAGRIVDGLVVLIYGVSTLFQLFNAELNFKQFRLV